MKGTDIFWFRWAARVSAQSVRPWPLRWTLVWVIQSRFVSMNFLPRQRPPPTSRWGLTRLSQSRRSRRAAIGSPRRCCQWPPTWKCDELDKFAVLLLKSSSPRPSRTKWSRIVCRPSGSAANIYYTPASRGPVGTGTFTIVSSSAALGLATGGCSVQCQCYYSPMCF